jgi:hypothetical protein
VRGFDVDDRVAAAGRQGQRLGVAGREVEVRETEALARKAHVLFADVDAGVAGRLQYPRQVVRTAPATAAHFHDPLSGKRRIADEVAVELQAEALGFVRRGELRDQRREAVVHERKIVGGRGGRVVELARLLTARAGGRVQAGTVAGVMRIFMP